jgi:hypothetical protein
VVGMSTVVMIKVNTIAVRDWFLTFTFSKYTGQVEEDRIPSLSSFLPMVKPGVSLSTTKVVMPL